MVIRRVKDGGVTWADKAQAENDISEFTRNGDAAPPGRFNYLFIAESF